MIILSPFLHEIPLLGTRSRQQHSKNLGSKKGNVFKVSSHSKTILGSAAHTKTSKQRVYVAKAEKTKIHDNDSDVVVAKPPKVPLFFFLFFIYTRLTTFDCSFISSNPRPTNAKTSNYDLPSPMSRKTMI